MGLNSRIRLRSPHRVASPERHQLVFWRMLRFFFHLRWAVWRAANNDVFTVAKAAAYSSILCVFPTLLVLTTILALTPETNSLLGEIRGAFEQILPRDTMDLVQIYFQNQHGSSVKALTSASIISVLAAMEVMLSLMEGFRRAYRLPPNVWKFWKQRATAALLIVIFVAPMAFATMLVVFGHQIESWMVANADHDLRSYVLFLWMLTRWSIALLTGISVLGVIYHFGTPRLHTWKWVLPGSAMATVLWFLATLLFGWYVTRVTNYSVVYGSLGAVIATLVWLYITSLSVLLGAEFNAQIYRSNMKEIPDSSAEAALAQDENPVTSARPQPI